MADENDTELPDDEIEETSPVADNQSERSDLADDFVDPGMVRSTPNPAKPEKKGKEKPAPEPEKEEKEEEEEPEPEEEEEEEEEEAEEPDPDAPVDFDAPAKVAKGKKGKEAPEEEEFRPIKEGEDRREYQAKKEGFLRKQVSKKLETTSHLLQQRELDYGRMSKEIDDLKAQVSEAKVVRADYRQDPKWKELHTDLVDSIRDDAEILDVRGYTPATVEKLAGELAAVKAKSGDEYDTAMLAFRKKITETLGRFDTEYEDIDPAERAAFETKVLASLRKHVPNIKKLYDLSDEIKTKAEKGISVLQNRQYEALASRATEKLDTVGKLSEEVVEKNPHTVAAQVTRLVNDHPEEATKLKRVLRDVREAFLGPPPLSEEDVKRLEASGTDLKKFETDRQKNFETSRDKMMVMAAETLMLRGHLAEMSEKLAKYEAKENGEDEERSTLRKVVKRQKSAANGEPEYVPPGKRRILTPAKDKMLGPDWRDD